MERIVFHIDFDYFYAQCEEIRDSKLKSKSNIRKQIFTINGYIKNYQDHIIKTNKINLLCLAGFMRILSKEFIQKCKFKIINIHPSLLPKYKGLNTHERAIQAGDKYAGSTVHYVNEKLDSGKKIIQAKVKILKRDTPSLLAKRVLKAEHVIYPKALCMDFQQLALRLLFYWSFFS